MRTYHVTKKFYDTAIRLQSDARLVLKYPDSKSSRLHLKRALKLFEVAIREDLNTMHNCEG